MTGTVEATIFSTARSDSPDLWSLLSAAILRRALVIALGLGSILTLANQAQAIFGAEALQMFPMMLVFLTPFVVITVSQLLGVQRAHRDSRGGARHVPADDTVLLTALRHGIPSRALRLGLLAGGLNASLVMTLALFQRGDLDAVSWPLLAQAFGLSTLFGALSQSIAYRRAAVNLQAQTHTVKGDGQ